MTDFICAVDGVVGRQGRQIGICGSIKCGSDDCGYKGDCEHQRIRCWSCNTVITKQQRADADGNCPECGCEIVLEEQSDD